MALVLGVAVLAGVTSWVGLGLAGGSGRAVASRAISPSTTLCAPLPYQPCGQPPAPHTDGLRCLYGWYDLDGQAADGCEATADGVNGQRLVARQALSANLVPAGDVDTYPTHVSGGSFFSCGGRFTVTLRAPNGVTDQVQILKGNKVVAFASSSNGQAASASVSKPSCLGTDSANFTVRVSGITGSTGADYTLTRNSGW